MRIPTRFTITEDAMAGICYALSYIEADDQSNLDEKEIKALEAANKWVDDVLKQTGYFSKRVKR